MGSSAQINAGFKAYQRFGGDLDLNAYVKMARWSNPHPSPSRIHAEAPPAQQPRVSQLASNLLKRVRPQAHPDAPVIGEGVLGLGRVLQRHGLFRRARPK